MEGSSSLEFSSKTLKTNVQHLSERNFVSKDIDLNISEASKNRENLKDSSDLPFSLSVESRFRGVKYKKQPINSLVSTCQTSCLGFSSVESVKKNEAKESFSHESSHSNHCNVSYTSYHSPLVSTFTGFQKKYDSENLLLNYKDQPSKIVKLKIAPRSFLWASPRSFFRGNRQKGFSKKKEIEFPDQGIVCVEKATVNCVDSQSICPLFLSKTSSDFVSVSTLVNTKVPDVSNSTGMLVSKPAPWPTFENVHVKDFFFSETMIKDIFMFRKKRSIQKKLFSEDYYLKEYSLLLNQEESVPRMHFLHFNQTVYSTDDFKSLATSSIPYSDLKRSCFDKIYKGLDNVSFSVNFFDIELWTSKYSPTKSHEVIFSEYEVIKLRDWLISCKLTSNVVRMSRTSLKKHVLERNDKTCLSKFINCNGYGEKSLFLNEISESKVLLKRRKKLFSGLQTSSVRYMLLVGPHGSYKSASVYAIAKELGFEIFEINSSTRRSGKDILDAVGEMSQSHLVNGKKVSGSSNICFKTKCDTSFQKQSLILIEEVDILYEEDKGFWNAVINLICKSKRPVIMTCTGDTSTIPNVFLEFQSVVYFKTAPVDLAANYLYLLSLSEGYIFRKEDLSLLYVSKKCDLRASILQLQFFTRIKNNYKISGSLNDTNLFMSDISISEKVVFENIFWPSIEWPNNFYKLLETITIEENCECWNLIDNMFRNSIENIKLENFCQFFEEIEKRVLFLDAHLDFLDAVSFCDYLSSKASCYLFEGLCLSNSDYLSFGNCCSSSDNLLGHDLLLSYEARFSVYQTNYVYIFLTIFIISCSIFSDKLNNTGLDTLNIFQCISDVKSLNIMSKLRHEVDVEKLTIDGLKDIFCSFLFSDLLNHNIVSYSINILNGFSLSVDIAPYIRDIIRFCKLYKENYKKHIINDNGKNIVRKLSVLGDYSLRKLNKYKMKNEKAILDTWIK
ncbi:hypothetical protein PORY_001907 [Pneumocystis oryctolagi]|uniref:Uncharacterized protein n=1 Tax=Pneumocystis oryctolagi TaxID=42067 RepID=A0ACB7CAW1_9ASCO|nr:hypothetical protein PORY_001907 [Pneumocystis oryctolagi]